MLFDYHLHTSRCGHARGTMEEYVIAARSLGIGEIGFSDHIPLYWLPEAQRDPGLAMSFSQLPGYIEEVNFLQRKYSDMTIKLGIEADYIPGHEDELKKVLDQYSFDYVLGSVHYIDGWGFDNPAYIAKYQEWDINELYERYFALLQQAAQSGLFHVMAHCDLIKKLGYRTQMDLQSLYRETAKVFSKTGVIVELNTAGLRAPAGEIYPHPSFIEQCTMRGIRFTLGSDAHKPEQVGMNLEQAFMMVDRKHIVKL